jgi:23S rRNA pseudouridine2605 synthase
MFETKKVLMAAALGLAGLMAIPASAQYNPNNQGWHRDHDRDHDGDHDRDHDRNRNNGYYNNGNYNNGNYANNAAYQQGYKDGIWDTQHGPQQRSRSWKNDYDAQAYRAGYNAGYRGNSAYNNGAYNNRRGTWNNNRGSYGYGNGGYYGNGAYGNYSQQAQIDGMNDGTRDRETGHSFRPTEQPGWKHPDRGYNSSMGISKQQYEQMYRDTYMQAYRQGYYGNGRR